MNPEEIQAAWFKIIEYAKGLGVGLNPVIQVTSLPNEKSNEEDGKENASEETFPAQEASNGDEAESK